MKNKSKSLFYLKLFSFNFLLVHLLISCWEPTSTPSDHGIPATPIDPIQIPLTPAKKTIPWVPIKIIPVPIDPTQAKSSITGVFPDQIEFPYWFIENRYDKGGSPNVVVFEKDGSIWTRTKANDELSKINLTWSFEAQSSTITISGGAEITFGTSDLEWDHTIWVHDTQLIRGTPDYTASKLTGSFVNNTSVFVVDMAGTIGYLSNAILRLKKDSSVLMAGGNTPEAAIRFLEQWEYLAKLNITWSISHFGDVLEFKTASTGNTTASFNGTQMVITVDYPHPFYALIENPGGQYQYKCRAVKATMVPEM